MHPGKTGEAGHLGGDRRRGTPTPRVRASPARRVHEQVSQCGCVGGTMRRVLLAIVLALLFAAPAAAETRILRFDPAQASRADLRSSLRAQGLRTHVFQRLPFAAVDGTAAQLTAARGLDGVVSSHRNERLRWYLHEAGNLLYGGAAERQANYAAGFGGHGTHVAGTVAGDGSASDGFYTGIAPGAKIVGLGTGDGANIFFALEAFDYILAHPELGITAVNNSWGGDGRFDAQDPVNVATKRLHEAGITVVFAFGNSG